MMDDVTAVVGAGLVQDGWVEDRRLYGGKEYPRGGVVDTWFACAKGRYWGGWGHRTPVVVSRVVKSGAVRVSVKMEVLLGETAAALVKCVAVFLGVRNKVELHQQK